MDRQKRTPKKDGKKEATKPRRVRRPVKPWREAFLAQLSQNANVLLSCKTAKVSRAYVYETRNSDAEFAKLWDAAVDEAIDVLEEEAWRRAVKGVTEPVFGSLGHGQGTGEVGQVQKYSDVLLIFLMKAGRPQKYRERVEHSGNLQHSEVVVYLPDNGRGDNPGAINGDGNKSAAQTG